MKIALCQINPIIGDFDHNTSLIMEAVEKAKTEGASLAIFPELSLLGYPPKDLLEKPAFIDENLIRLEHLAAKIKDIAQQEGVGLNDLVRYILQNFVDQYERGEIELPVEEYVVTRSRLTD